MYYLFPLGFAPFNTFHFNVSFTDCLSLFIKWREREKREVKTRKQMTPTTSSYSGTHTHTQTHTRNSSTVMQACALWCYIALWKPVQSGTTTVIRSLSYNSPLEAAAGGRSCVCHGDTHAQGYWLALGSHCKLSSLRAWTTHPHPDTHTHRYTHIHPPTGIHYAVCI